MSGKNITIHEAVRMSNIRNRNQTINDMNFNSDDNSDDDTYNPSSDDYTSSQETEIYEEEEKASSIYRFFYMYTKNKSAATLLASCMMALFSFCNIIVDIFSKIYSKGSNITGYFTKTSYNCMSFAKKFSIIISHFIVYILAVIGLFFICFSILYQYGYLVLTPINYLVPYK